MSDETRRPGSEPPNYVGPENHGPEPPATRGPRRMIVSGVWGGTGATVTSAHGEDVRAWNPDCSWYQYGLQLCLNGCQHPGMDIGIPRGTALFAARGGTVEFAGWARFYRPHHVDIRTDDGDLDIYAHMWSVDAAVTAGSRVEAGQYLGTSGEQTIAGTMEPDGSGAHLHFEARSGGCVVDPEPILVAALAGGQISNQDQFQAGDRIEVVNGPLNLRDAGSIAGNILDSLGTGTVLVVLEGPVWQGGHGWYRISVAEQPWTGWVAGEFCRFVGP